MKLFLFAILFACSTHAAEFHVAPAGNDANAGTKEKPFATLERARDAVRHSKATHSGANSIVVYGGEYHLTKPVVFTPADSGASGQALTITAAPGEKPVFTSATPITNWKLAAPATPNLAKEAQGKVWVADIPTGWRIHFLYADGKPMPVARLFKTTQWRDWPTFAKCAEVGPGGQLQTVKNPAELEGLPSNGDVEMNYMPVGFWNSLSVVRDINPAQGTLRRHSKNPTLCDGKTFAGGHYNLQNALKFLTTPGEWCVDSAAGKVFFWPEQGEPATMKIVAPRLYRLMEMAGSETPGGLVHDIVLRGLSFQYTDRLPEDEWPDAWIKRQAEVPDAMLFMEGVDGCVVDSCEFLFSGSYGVALMNYAQRNRVTRNEMGFPGCGGVLLQGYGPGKLDVNKNNVVERNYIHHTGNGGYLHSAAVTLYQSGENLITLNWLDHMPYTAIAVVGAHSSHFGPGRAGPTIWDSYGNDQGMYGVRWAELPQGRDTSFNRETIKPFLFTKNNRVTDNVVINYMERLHDGGALYSWACGTNNLWEGNLLQGHTDGFMVVAMYMDDDSDNAILRHNICWHVSRPTESRGQNIVWDHNEISAQKPVSYDARLAEIITAIAKAGGLLKSPDGDVKLLVSGQDLFLDTSIAALVSIAGGDIHYTLDGSEPSAQSPLYTAPIAINTTTTLKAVLLDRHGSVLASTTKTFTKLPLKKLSAGAFVKAAEFSKLEGPKFDDKQETIGFCDGGGAFVFGAYDIADDPVAIELMVAVDPVYAGGKVHIHLDSKTGPEIAVHQFQSTGSFYQFSPQKALITNKFSGKHTLWFVFESGFGNCNFKGFRLLSAQTNP